MGQGEILDFLQRQRERSARWWGISDIRRELRAEGWSDGKLRGVANDLLRLACFNMVECKGIGWWNHQKLFRARRR